MNHLSTSKAGLVLAFAAAFAGPSGWAQDAAGGQIARCRYVGPPLQEPLGDRDGHALSTSQISCRIEGGAMDGAIMAGLATYEWQGGSAVGLFGNGVSRKPGATLAYVNTEAKLSLVMDGGRVVGSVSSGRGRYVLATGSAAPLLGKTYSYTTKPTGYGEFIIDIKQD